MRGLVGPVTPDRARRPTDAGGVHHGPQRAELLGRLDRGDDLLGVGDVGRREHAAGLLGQGVALLLLTIEVQDDDLGALLGQGTHGCLTQARSSTGHDCGCTTQFQHGGDSMDRTVTWASWRGTPSGQSVPEGWISAQAYPDTDSPSMMPVTSNTPS